MDGIKIEVTGNIARVTDRPARLTSGMVGLPVEFTFDSHWDGLSKTAVFRAGKTELIAEGLETETTVPWEALDKPNVWLSIGVYGASADGTIVIPTIWANVCLICEGVNPDGDVSTAPTLPVWQRLLNAVGNLLGLTTNAKDNLVDAINEVHNIALAGGIETDPTLSQSGKAADAKVTGDVIQTHANDQKNPHKVTAEQTGARPSTWMPTATEVGARPNTWMPTSVDVGAAPAIEDATYAGCYYRMVDGEREWINPPFIRGEEYRTTERLDGLVVYTKLVDFGAMPANSVKTVHDVVAGNIFHVDGIVFNADGYIFVTFATTSAITVDFMGKHVSVGTTYDFSNCTAYLIVKFLK